MYFSLATSSSCNVHETSSSVYLCVLQVGTGFPLCTYARPGYA